ncbi:hypothetical protein QZH41_018443 [Actinostola sp. cb2023]|nr:hypothetical protein QZH41_018443 [Actinostola sp. cb2023]
MFETFKVPGLFIANSAILVLYAYGRVTGLVLDSGDGVTSVSPVFEGYLVPEGKQTLPVGGRDLNDYLVRLLDDAIDREMAHAIKEQICCVSLDGSSCSSDTGAYRMPDGKEITLNDQRYKVSDPLFQPTILGLNSQGVHQMVHHAIAKCEMDTKIKLYSNILLAGGSTMFPGFEQRLQKEVSSLAPTDTLRECTHVVADKNRALAAWIGGSIFACQPSFNDQLCVTKKEYQEMGVSALERKFPQ